VKRVLLLLFALPAACLAQGGEKRLEVGGLLTGVFLEEIGTRDVGAGTGAGGLGGRVTWRLLPVLDLDADLILHPNAGVSGHRIQTLVGVKTGKRFEKLGFFAKARPGFIYFSKDPFGVGRAGATPLRPDWASSLEPSLDIGGVVEYYTSRGLILRFDLGDTIVSYEPRTVITSSFLPPIQAGGFTTHNVQWSIGVSLPF
jgi:hypothetical protein